MSKSKAKQAEESVTEKAPEPENVLVYVGKEWDGGKLESFKTTKSKAKKLVKGGTHRSNPFYTGEEKDV